MGRLLVRATQRSTLAHVRHVSPVAPRAAGGLVEQVYRQVERDFGMLAPPVALHSPAPSVLAACWVMLRESLVADSATATREAKEAVAAAVSLANQCPYCVEVHGATLVGLLHSPDARAVASGRFEAVGDPWLRGLAEWAYSGGPGRLPAEFIAVAVTFHYLNRMVNVFLQESPFPAGVPALARRNLGRVAARLMGSLARHRRFPGSSLDLLPAAPQRADLAWAATRPSLADAFARAFAAIEAGGERSVPGSVRELVLTWNGKPPGINVRAWLDEVTAGVSTSDLHAARLAMLVAYASHQISPGHVHAFQRHHPGDQTLVEFAAWVSLTAARRIGAGLV